MNTLTTLYPCKNEIGDPLKAYYNHALKYSYGKYEKNRTVTVRVSVEKFLKFVPPQHHQIAHSELSNLRNKIIYSVNDNILHDTYTRYQPISIEVKTDPSSGITYLQSNWVSIKKYKLKCYAVLDRDPNQLRIEQNDGSFNEPDDESDDDSVEECSTE
jgi:hypothetical protein